MNKNDVAKIFIASIKCDDMPIDQCHMKCDTCPFDVSDETFYQAQKEIVTWLTPQEVVTKEIEVPDSAGYQEICCPRCGAETIGYLALQGFRAPCCPYCGQALDWSKMEDGEQKYDD